jgi:hypothetical protein
MKQTRKPRGLAWLESQDLGDTIAGFDPSGWEASTWILHAIYEKACRGEDVTHDDVWRSGRAAGTIPPLVFGDLDIEALLPDDAVMTGTPLGRTQHPGEGWTRVRWAELADRLGIDPFAQHPCPGDGSFPFASWPASISPPGEGSLDRGQFVRLTHHLATESGDTRCFAHYSPLASGEYDEAVLYVGPLAEIVDLYDETSLTGSPTNFWPEDRSWFVYTNWDLWGTKVSGNRQLIDELERDPELETATLAC